MYKITSPYIFEIKEPITERITLHTTRKISKIMQDIALDNDISVSMLINNAIANYLINDINNEDEPT